MRKLLSIIIFCFFFAVSAYAGPVSAQVFKFDPVTSPVQICEGTSFSVKVLINTAGQQTINGDALITFDPAKVSINSAQNGSFYTYFSANPLGGVDNKYLVSSYEISSAYSKASSADTLFATLALSAKAAGVTSLSFICAPNTNSDSNINRASDYTDIISCPLTPLNLTIQAAGACGGVTGTPTPVNTTPSPTAVIAPTSTPIPTSTPVPKPTNTPIPTSAPIPPVSGSTEIVLVGLGMGTFLTIMGLLFIL